MNEANSKFFLNMATSRGVLKKNTNTTSEASMTSARNARESPIACAFVESLLLLGYEHDPAHGVFGPRMFSQSNEKGLFAILYFLFTKINQDSANVQISCSLLEASHMFLGIKKLLAYT